MTESPNGTHYHIFTKHEILGKFFVPCWPVFQSDEQMSPFTSNFTSDVTQTLVQKAEREREGGAGVVFRSEQCRVIKCKGTIIVKGSCNDNHKDLKVIM